ncbi:MAG: DJ-1/PfpI family protein [Candidatus Paceibacterota bacterium]
MKKAIMIIASKNFRDEEYFITKEVLKKGGVLVKTACDKSRAIGKFGGEAEADILINDLKVDEFDAVILPGGSGASELLDNELTYSIVKDAFYKKKLVAAICIAPTILARAGILEGKNATVWSSSLDKSAINILRENGAVYARKEIVIDGNIITGENAEFSQEFGETILKELTKS